MFVAPLSPLSWIDVIAILACWFAGVFVIMATLLIHRRRGGRDDRG